MRFVYGAISCLLTATAISGFTSIISPSKRNRYALTSHASTRSSSSTTTSSSNSLKEVVAVATELRNEKITVDDERQKTNTRTKSNNIIEPLTEKEINARLGIQLNKMQAKDSQSLQLSKEDLKTVYEDDHLYVVDKPSGVLSVPNKIVHPSLAQTVFDAVGCEMGRMDMMVVHRLGMDTSGLMVFAKTMDALRGMNTVFRTRDIERKYEALVCGHVEQDSGMINLPLMRDYEFPPFMRISTDDHQRALVDLDPEQLENKKLLDLPKEALTKYEVISREDLDGQPVTRVALTSLSGRTHQLNVHMAAFGHPIVGDDTYGINGDAAPNGGLTDAELEELIPNPNRATDRLQRRIAATGTGPCVHAKSLKFRHPVSGEELSFVVDAPF